MSRRRHARQRPRRKGTLGRVVGMGLGGTVLVLIVGMLGGYFWLTNYLQGEKFLNLVNTKASEALGAEVVVRRLHWDGMLVKSPLIEVDGEELIQQAEIEDVETEVKLTSLLRKQVVSSPIHIRKAHVEVDVTKRKPSLPEATETYEFPGAKVDLLSGAVSFGGPALFWEGVQASARSGGAKGSYSFLLSGGQVRTPIALFPEGDVQEMRIRYYQNQLYVTEADFQIYESGRLNLTGEVQLSEGAYLFDGKLRDVFGHEMVPEDWKKRLEGTLQADFTVEGAGKKLPIISGHLEMLDGVLTSLPILDRIAAYAETARFRRLVLTEAHLNFRQEGERLLLSEIVLASEGLVRVEGKLEVVGEKLTGTFRLGLTPGTLARIPGAETKVFFPGERGLLWSPVRLSGTLSDPKEDLSRRLIVAAGQRMFELVPETGQWVLRHTGRRADELAQEVLESGSQVTEIGSGVIEQGNDLLRSGADAVGEGVDAVIGLIPGVKRPQTPPQNNEEDEEKGKP